MKRYGWYPVLRSVGLGPQLAELERLFREGKVGKMNGVGIAGIDHVHHMIAASRHLDLETSGEERNPDSGALHLVHAAARLLMAAACLERELEVNSGAFEGVTAPQDTEVMPVMREDQRGDWVLLVDAEQHCAQQSLQKLQELLQTRLRKGNVSVSGALERMVECEYLGREPDATDEHIMRSLMGTLGEFIAWLKAKGND